MFYLARQPEQDTAGLRIGFTVGKALGGAVERNRIKRRLREAVRLAGFSPQITADVVVNPKRSALNVEFSALRSEIEKGLQVIERSSQKGQPR